jgi:hypothetical protein
MPDTPAAQLIHLATDRRLGHEWDEWDGAPLPNRGDFDTRPAVFFAWSAGTVAVTMGILWAGFWLLRPRMGPWSTWVAVGLGGMAALAWVWWVLLVLSYVTRPLLPEWLAERGPFLRLMRGTSRLADRFGRRDWVENAATKVFNTLALRRQRRVQAGELLLLVPRCLSRESLDGVLAIAGKYAVPVFVATRGQLARRAIRERRPRAVVAVACERDLVSGLHDVAGKVPVLALPMRLPSGPCKDAGLDLGRLEEWVRAYVS